MYNNLSKEKLIELLRQKDTIIAHKDRVSLLGEYIEELSAMWKAPLHMISQSSGSLQMKFMMELVSEEDLKQELNSIIVNADFLAQSIKDFSEFCKDQRHKTVLNVATCLNKLESMVSYNLETKHIKMALFCEQDIFIEGIENEFIELVLNIINNAIDVLSKNRSNQRKIDIKVFKDKQMVVLHICDNAGGIQKEYLPKVFDQYFSTKKEQGNGLGLFVCKRLIEENFEGHIDVFNTDDGACFEIHIPQYKFIHSLEEG